MSVSLLNVSPVPSNLSIEIIKILSRPDEWSGSSTLYSSLTLALGKLIGLPGMFLETVAVVLVVVCAFSPKFISTSSGGLTS